MNQVQVINYGMVLGYITSGEWTLVPNESQIWKLPNTGEHIEVDGRQVWGVNDTDFSQLQSLYTVSQTVFDGIGDGSLELLSDGTIRPVGSGTDPENDYGGMDWSKIDFSDITTIPSSIKIGVSVVLVVFIITVLWWMGKK